MQRRTYLTTIGGIAAATTLAGCSDTSDDDYEGGDADDGQQQAEVDDGEGSNQEPEILDHEMVVEEPDNEFMDDDVFVRGTFKNHSDEMLDYAEVSVRVFNEDDQQLDTYMDNTTDLAGGAEWPFEVHIFDRTPDEIARYEIAMDYTQY